MFTIYENSPESLPRKTSGHSAEVIKTANRTLDYKKLPN